jgi:hypothetical protein
MIQSIFPPRERNEPYPNDAFADVREAIEDVTRCARSATPDAIRFGKYLAKNRGRMLVGRRIDRVAVDGDSNSIRWTVTRQATDDAPCATA